MHIFVMEWVCSYKYIGVHQLYLMFTLRQISFPTYLKFIEIYMFMMEKDIRNPLLILQQAKSLLTVLGCSAFPGRQKAA